MATHICATSWLVTLHAHHVIGSIFGDTQSVLAGTRRKRFPLTRARVSKTALGWITLTLIPSAPHSRAATRATWVSAALEAEYAAAPGPGAGTFFRADHNNPAAAGRESHEWVQVT